MSHDPPVASTCADVHILTAQQDKGGPEQPSRKRTRITQACRRCKQRRARCDGVQPVCGECKKGGAVCELPDPQEDGRKRRKTRPPAAKRAAGDSSRASVELESYSGVPASQMEHGGESLGFLGEPSGSSPATPPFLDPENRRSSALPPQPPTFPAFPSFSFDPVPPPAALPAPASLNQPQPPPPDFLSLGFSTALAPSIPSVTDPSTSLQILADASTASSQPYDLFSSDASFPARPAMSQPSESTDGDRSVPSISYLRPFGVTGIQPGLERIVISLAAPPSFSRAQSPALPPSFPQDAFPFLSDPAALPAFRPNQHNSHVSISSAAALSQEERLFEAGSDLPRPELKAELFDLFFRHLGSHFPFLNRQAVERCDNCKVSTSMDAPMLVLSICALAARFSMSPAITGTDTTRSPGLYGVPFADRAKKMILPLLGFPSTRTVQSLLLLSWSEFGQNNDGSFWSLSGMAMRMAVDLGLQLDIEQPHLDAREQAVNRLTWWACLAHDRMLSLGTGRPVMVKSYEVTTPFPSEEDISLVSGHVSPVPSAFPAYCRFMLLCGDLCDVVNNGKGRWKMAPPTSEHADPAENGAPHRTEGRPLQPLEGAITQAYAALPHPLKWSSPNFRKHHDAGLGPIFLHLHLWYHCILIMLYSPPLMYPQLKAASLSLSDRLSVVTRSCLQVSQIIGVAELVGDSPAYEAAPFTNQTFFVSASAWIRDHHIRTGRSILDNSNTTTPSASFSNFPPSSSGPADLLAQSASDEFHLCRNALLRQEKYWLGAGWLAAVVGRKGATVSRTTIETATKGMRTYVSDGEMTVFRRLAQRLGQEVQTPELDESFAAFFAALQSDSFLAQVPELPADDLALAYTFASTFQESEQLALPRQQQQQPPLAPPLL